MNFIFKKQALFIAILCSILYFSCDNNYENVFSESADVRVRKTMQQYETRLMNAKKGWRAILKTGSGVRYYYYFQFKNDGTVQMVSDFNVSTTTPMPGTWKLKALQRITLSFDTYSYVHLPADPNGEVNGGPNGEGRVSDTEFAFSGTSGDTLLLEGIQRGSTLSLVEATDQEAQLALDGQMKNMLETMAASNGLYFTLDNDQVVTLAFDLFNKVVVAQFITMDGHVGIIKSPYLISSEGLELNQSFTTGGLSVSKFLWNDEAKLFTMQSGNNNYALNPIDQVIIFNPDYPLHEIIGNDFLAIAVPGDSRQHPLPGQSAAFINAHETIANNLSGGQYSLTLSDMYFVFAPAEQRMYINVVVTRGNDFFLCGYYYDYTKTQDGIYDFTYGGADPNGAAIFSDMSPVFNLLESDRFRLQYLGGGYDLTGGFFSVENPDFTFSGFLTN